MSTEATVKTGLQIRYPCLDLSAQFQVFVDEEEYDSDLIQQDIIDEDNHEILQHLLSENASLNKDELNQALQEILNNPTNTLQLEQHCSIIKDSRDKKIVSAFVSKHCREYKLCEFDLDIYTEFILFYGRCFLELPETEQATPFTILFAVFNMRIPLQITGWDLCDPNTQCQYLSATKTFNDLIEKQYNFENIPNNIVFEIKHMIEYYNNKSQSLLHSKYINEWNDCDIMLSIVWYFVEAVKVGKEELKILWSFVDQFRRFLYDNEYDGRMLVEYMLDCKNNYSQVIKDVCWNNKLMHIKYSKVTSLFKQWCENINGQFGITNDIHSSHKLLYSVMTTTQQFIYDKNEKIVCSNSLLIGGYTRNEDYDYIPDDVQKIIESFYGKTYNVSCSRPQQNEFDYAVEILVPMKTIGIYHKANVVDECFSAFAQKNIIPKSKIIQINDIVIKGTESGEELSKILSPAKQSGNSLIVFRAEKELNEKGTHFMFDIKLKKEYEMNQLRFKYHKFQAGKVLDLFKGAFRGNYVEILHLYGNRECLSGGGTGITVLLFVDGYIECSRYKLFKINNLIQEGMGREFDVMLSFTMKGLKGYGINSAWSNIPLTYWSKKTSSMSGLIYLVKGIDEGRDAWYYVFVDIDKLDPFLKALDDDTIHLEDHGHILYSAYGSEPPQQITDKLKAIWKID